ncbi:hypothetical protein NPIL_681561, partial [Nephila pilipes]
RRKVTPPRHSSFQVVLKIGSIKTINPFGLDRESNPGPLAPEARIIPLDHRAAASELLFVSSS